MISWMLYSLVVGALVALAARGMEEVCRLLGQPLRWVWAGALVLLLALIATAPSRAPAAPTGTMNALAVEAPVQFPLPDTPSLEGRTTRVVNGVIIRLTAIPMQGAYMLARHLPDRLWGRTAGAVWITLSVFVLLAFVGSALHFRWIRNRFPLMSVLDVEVRVSRRLGPAVMGLVWPEIVVPRWLLSVPVDHQRLVLTHEVEHRRARDPLLLALGWLGIVLVPWHPALWWMASRLRLAAEVDCDARVLRSGVEPLRYGSLLIEIAGRCSTGRLGTPALAGSRSHLERRLLAMLPTTHRFAGARGALLSVLTAAALAAACEAALPTAADIHRMDVAAAEQGARRLALSDRNWNSDGAEYRINGLIVTAAEARALPQDRIKSIIVARPTHGRGPTKVHVWTQDARTAAEPAAEKPGDYSTFGMMAAEGSLAEPFLYESKRREGAPAEPEVGRAGEPKPLILIDGAEANEAALRALSGMTFRSVEMIKGPEALAAYGVAGAGGVIRITTR